MDPTIPPDVTPQQGATIVTVGGTGILSIPPGAYGGYIWNPWTNTDQGIVGAAEPLYVNPMASPDLQGFGATVTLYPGDFWKIPLPKSTSGVYVNAPTSGHRFTSVYWIGP